MNEIPDEVRLQEIVKELNDITNNICYSPEHYGVVLGEALTHQHRTIQQSIIATLINALVWYADCATSDGRNEYVLQACKDIRDILKERKKLSPVKDAHYSRFPSPFI